MNELWKDLVFLGVCYIVLICYRKILEYHNLKQTSYCEDETIYLAAKSFAKRDDVSIVKSIIMQSSDFTNTEAETIISKSIKCRGNSDGGYREFLKSVNKTLGITLYES